MANIDIQMKGPIGPDEVVSVSHIPGLTLSNGQTYDLGQYIRDVGNRLVTSSVTQGGAPLSTSKLSYDPVTQQLSALDVGVEGGLALEVEW